MRLYRLPIHQHPALSTRGRRHGDPRRRGRRPPPSRMSGRPQRRPARSCATSPAAALTGLVVGIVACGHRWPGGRCGIARAPRCRPRTGAFTENGNRNRRDHARGNGRTRAHRRPACVVGRCHLGRRVAVASPVAASCRAIVTVPLAVAIGGSILIVGDNRDFFILDRHPSGRRDSAGADRRHRARVPSRGRLARSPACRPARRRARSRSWPMRRSRSWASCWWCRPPSSVSSAPRARRRSSIARRGDPRAARCVATIAWWSPSHPRRDGALRGR